jgi:hypothetical protein
MFPLGLGLYGHGVCTGFVVKYLLIVSEKATIMPIDLEARSGGGVKANICRERGHAP